ncbi:MAG TPA: 5-(carboxyamino)imidazole ribonucleotide synthase [Woeseiaceae bacterium]|nr:5-(carboxyamino)imidazole ribonucleotide synthase [Woeseiaceae bacterium]
MRIGIIGAGQLGRMLGFAARELGHTCTFLDPADNPPAAAAGATLCAAYDDADALAALARGADVVTYEFENVPIDALLQLPADTPVYPPPEALRLAQDRLSEKALFARLDIPLPPYRHVDERRDLDAAAADLGFPLVLKTRRFGYDGKGQFVVRAPEDSNVAWEMLGGRPLVAEAWVPFEREVSIIGARGLSGESCAWPLTENRHRDGILQSSLAPVNDAGLTAAASRYLHALLDALDYIGVLALELFVSGNGLFANEFAPRVHNSGHWTIEGSTTSQFANHIRAVTGDRLGPADCREFVGMVNLIGSLPQSVRDFTDHRATLHDYGKTPRPGRKLGHVTVCAADAAERDRLLASVDELLRTASANAGTTGR